MSHVHPLYASNRALWEECRLSYEGGRAYLKRYLAKHSKERSEDWLLRLERSFYPNHIRAIVDTYAAHLFRAHIPRKSDSATLQAFWDDVDLLHNSADEFYEAVSQLVQRDGRAAIVVDRHDPDAGAAQTRAQEREAGRRPYAYVVAAEDVIDWDVDRLGNMQWAMVRELSDVERDWMTEHPGVAYQYRVWTPAEWILYREQGEGEEAGLVEVDRGEHPVGEVPLVWVFWGRRQGVEPISEPAIGDLTPMARRLTNLYSLIDEQIYQHVFNIMAVPESTYAALQGVDWSVSGAIPFKDDVRNTPFYLGPDVSQIRAIQEQIEKTESSLRQLSGLGRVNEDTKHVQTGIALSYLTMDKDALLAKFAQKMERAEAQVDLFAQRWMGESAESERQYPDSFDPLDLKDELDAALKFAGLGLQGEAMVENAIQAIKARLGPRVSSERLEEIESDLRRQLSGDNTISL